MSNSGVNVFSKQARFHITPAYNAAVHICFTRILACAACPIIKLEIYVQFLCQRFLETGEVSGPGTNSIEQRGHVRVANHIGFSFYR